MLITIFLAASLRLFRLGYQSSWNDEAISAVISGGTTYQIVTNQFYSLHPPAYYLLLHFWQTVAGSSDLALRLPSALMGILSVAVMYLLGRLLFGSRAGVWAAAVTALMPFHLYYSQEMRMYSQVFLLACLALLCQVQLWRDKRKRWWPVYLVVCLLGLYSHYFFTFLVAAFGLYFLVRSLEPGTQVPWRAFAITHLAMAFLYTPIVFWLQEQLTQSQNYWVEGLTLGHLFSVPLVFTVGQFLPPPLLLFAYSIVLALLLILLLQAGRSFMQSHPERWSLFLALTAFTVPVVLMFVISIVWTPLTVPRLLMVSVPGFYLLIAWSAAVPKERLVNVALVILLLSVAVIADYNWLLNSQFSKPPSREAAYTLREKVLPGETVVYANDSGFRLFYRYVPDLDHRLFIEGNTNPQVRPELFRLMGGDVITSEDPLTEIFWLVLHQDFEIEEQEAIFQLFESRHQRIASEDVGGIRMYQYRYLSVR
jgi:mannosyltransferase